MANDIPVKQARSVTSTAASDSDEKGMESTPPSKRKKPEKTTQIQTACMYCRGSKMKCIRNSEEEDCKRCIAASIKCETFARKSGRKPGQGTKRVFPKIDRSQPGDTAASESSNDTALEVLKNLPPMPARSPQYPSFTDNANASYVTAQPNYSDLQNVLQERMAYEQQQNFMIPEPTGHRVTFANVPAEQNNVSHQSQQQQQQQQQQQHSNLFNHSNGSQDLHTIATIPSVNPLIGNVPAHNQYGVSSYPPSTTFNNNLPLPLQNAMHIPNTLFLPSFAALTSDPSSTNIQPPPRVVPTSQSGSSEGAKYSFTNVLQGSSRESGGTQRSNSWTPVSTSSATHEKEGNHGSLTITPLDMLATVGAKGDRLASSFPVAASTNAAHRELYKAGVKGTNAYASRAHLASITTQADYFSTTHHLTDLDWEPDNDPIGLSLVTADEARGIIDYYFQHCNLLNPLLDPEYHSYERLSTKSTFLLTAVLSIGAKFMEQHAAAAQRLDHHLRKILIPNAIMEGNSSLELVEGFMVLAPYADAGRHITLELTGTYLAVAHDRFKRLPRPKPGTDKESNLYQRSYERLHLIIFAYERGFALISGQTLGYLIPEPELASSVTQWAQAEGSTPADWDLGALCALRHAIPDILRIIAPKTKNEKDGGQAKMASPAIIKAVTAEMLSEWRATWFGNVTSKAYLTIVESHTSLSLWINALRGHVGHPTETAILQQALLAAIQTLQAVVGADEFSLRFLVNNTFVMVAYAAAFALRLLARWTETTAPVESSISLLISQVADRLQIAGRTPPHRYGRSWLYGQRLHEMLRDRMHSRRPSRASSPFNSMNISSNGMDGETGSGFAAKATEQGGGSEVLKLNGQEPLEQEYDIANMSPDRVDKLLSEYTWFPLESSTSTNDLLDWEAFFAG